MWIKNDYSEKLAIMPTYKNGQQVYALKGNKCSPLVLPTEKKAMYHARKYMRTH